MFHNQIWLEWSEFGDMEYRVDVHRPQESKTDGGVRDDLVDGVGPEPLVRKFLCRSVCVDIVCVEPDLVSDGVFQGL